MALSTDPAPGAAPEPGPTSGSGASALGAIVATALAVAAAIGVGELVAALVSPASSPFLAVGQAAIRLTPESVKEFAIATFGLYDKVALLGGMGLTIVLVVVVVGLASRHDHRPGLVLVVAFGLVAVAAVISAPAFAPADLLAPLVALLVGAAVWSLLHRLAVAAGEAEQAGSAGAPAGLARRRLLLSAGGVALGAGAAGIAGRALASGGTSPSSVMPLPTAAAAPALPLAGSDFVASGTPTWITSNADFYRIDTALSVPRISTTTWSLRIHGMVDREITLDYDALRSRRLLEAPITMSCVSNEIGGDLVSNAMFLGVPMRDLLAEAGVRPGAEQIASTSADGWTANTPLGPLTDGRPAMLAIGMNGAPLPVEHGFPVRMVVPGLYGYVSGCKWITDIEVTTFAAFTSYWEQRGWAQQGPVKTQSRIDVPRAGATVLSGPTTVAGVAWAPHTGIDGVEVSVDGGAWTPAELAVEPSADSWRMWRLVTTLGPGAHQLRVRAKDRSGDVQTPLVTPVIPDGASGWHTVQVTAV
jgi:DMSO/TMAO reductase YedYZ molybdopterin-dependent catalytic subunit